MTTKIHLFHHLTPNPGFYTGPYDATPTFARTPEGRREHNVSVHHGPIREGVRVYPCRNDDGSVVDGQAFGTARA